MKAICKTIALFCFFCLFACKDTIEHGEIIIDFINAEYAEIELYKLPENKLVYKGIFDRQYEDVKRIQGMNKGLYKLNIETELYKFDTTFTYLSVFRVEY